MRSTIRSVLTRSSLPYVLVCLGFAAASPARAEDAVTASPIPLVATEEATVTGDASSLLSMSLEDLLNVPVVTASRSKQRAGDAPAKVYSFPRETLQLRGYLYLIDLLEDVPEFEVNRFADPDAYDLVSARGLWRNNRFLILQDGIRINSEAGTPTALSNVYPLNGAQRVEILVGPASALYGADAMAATINIITVDPATLATTQASGSYGSFRNTDNSLLISHSFAPDVQLVLAGSFHRGSGANLPSRYPTDFAWYNNQYRNQGLQLTSPYDTTSVYVGAAQPYARPTLAYNLHLKFNFKDFELGYTRNSTRHSSAVGSRPELTLEIADSYMGTITDSLYGLYRHRGADDAYDLSTTFSLNKMSYDTGSGFQNSYTNYLKTYNYSNQLVARGEVQAGYRFLPQLTGRIGGTYFNQYGIPETPDLPRSFNSSLPDGVQDFYYVGTDVKNKNGKSLRLSEKLYNIYYYGIGGFAQLQWRIEQPLGRDTFFETTAGVRYDHDNRYGNTTNPRVGFVLALSANTRLKALYGEAYFAPAPYFAYHHYGTYAPTDSTGQYTTDPAQYNGLRSPYLWVPNTHLRPEKLRQAEIGLSTTVAKVLQLGVNAYYSYGTNFLNTSLSGPTTFNNVPVDTTETYVNTGRANIYGGTAEGSLHLRGEHVSLTPYGSYSYLGGTTNLNGDHRRPEFNARHSVHGGIDFSYRNLGIAPRILYRSASYQPVPDANNNDTAVAGYTLVNLNLRAANLIDTEAFKVSAYLNIRNLLNTRYRNPTFSGPEGAQNGMPQDPIKVMGGLVLTL